MFSLLTFNYFKSFLSFPIVDFEQVNICWKNYLTFYSCNICFNVPTGGRLDLTRSNAGNSVIFLISHTQWDVIYASLQLLNSFKEHWKVCINANNNFLRPKNKAGDCRESITSDCFPFIYDLYLKCNKIKSCYAKSAMTGKKGEKECRFIRCKT